MTPLFGAVPGGPELLIILLVLLLLFGPVVVIAVLAMRYFGSEKEVEKLEARIDALEKQVAGGAADPRDEPADDDTPRD